MYGVIYLVTNDINDKVYVGQTTMKPKERWNTHIRCSGYKKYKNKLYWALQKYGVEHFNFEVVDYANTREELDSLEEQYINKYNSINEGYNIKEGGVYGRHSAETIEKIREASTGRKHTPEAKLKMSKARSKIGSPWLRGKPRSQDTINKMKSTRAKNNPSMPCGESHYKYKGLDIALFENLIREGCKLAEIVSKLNIEESVLRAKWKKHYGNKSFRDLTKLFAK